MPSVSPGSSSTGSRGPSESRRWLKRRVSRKWIKRLAPKHKRKLVADPSLWDRTRKAITSWQLWAAVAFAFFSFENRTGGILSALAAIFFYLAAPRHHPAEYAIDTAIAPDSTEFLATMAGVTSSPVLRGNTLEILNDGDQFYPSMLKAIEQAKDSVTMEQYIFWDGEVGRRFADAFAERAEAGIPVKILVDAIGSSTIGEEILTTLEKAGCELAWFRPIRWYSLNRANFRTHRKSLIVDGRVAFTGGAGIADHWLGSARNDSEWRDIQVRVEGQAALAQQAGFAQNWLIATGEMIAGHQFFPKPETVGEIPVQTILSSPGGGAGGAASMYLLALQCAQRSIYIANPYFIPSKAVISILSYLSKRVDIRVMLSGDCCDTWWARQNSIRLYGQLLDAGVRIYEFKPTMLHQKYMVIDDDWATIGTANFDNRSFALNEETNLCFYDGGKVQQLQELFFKDLERCREIDRDSWQKRGIQQKVREEFASLMEDQV